MRRIFGGIIGAALLGLAVAACTGSHVSPTAPSATTTGGGGGLITTMAACAGPNSCQFGASAGTVLSGTYTGTTTAQSTPSNGHNGLLTLTFDQPYSGPVTFTWSGFQTGNQAVCTITASGFSKIVSCNDGSATFSDAPAGTNTYTFTDKKNLDQSADQWQVATKTITTGAPSASVTATWKSNFGAGDDDPGVTYAGTISGVLTSSLDGTLYANASSATKCGLGGGLPAASHFHLGVSSTSETALAGSYEAQDCTIDKGSFSVSK